MEDVNGLGGSSGRPSFGMLFAHPLEHVATLDNRLFGVCEHTVDFGNTNTVPSGHLGFGDGRRDGQFVIFHERRAHAKGQAAFVGQMQGNRVLVAGLGPKMLSQKCRNAAFRLIDFTALGQPTENGAVETLAGAGPSLAAVADKESVDLVEHRNRKAGDVFLLDVKPLPELMIACEAGRRQSLAGLARKIAGGRLDSIVVTEKFLAGGDVVVEIHA